MSQNNFGAMNVLLYRARRTGVKGSVRPGLKAWAKKIMSRASRHAANAELRCIDFPANTEENDTVLQRQVTVVRRGKDCTTVEKIGVDRKLNFAFTSPSRNSLRRLGYAANDIAGFIGDAWDDRYGVWAA